MPLTIKTYIDLAVGLAVIALVVFAGWEYDQRKLDAAALAAQAQTVTQLQQGLAQLQQGQHNSDVAIQAVAASAVVNNQHAATVRQRVVTMGKSDASVQSWLDTRGPVNLCVLDDTCAPSGVASGAVSGAASAVR